METSTFMCIHHNRENELICEGCKTYICPECVSDHGNDGHPAKYTHVLKYAPTYTMPKIDLLISDAKEREKAINAEATELVDTLQIFVPKLKELVKIHLQSAEMLKSLSSQLRSYSEVKPETVFHEKVLAGLESEKKKLADMIKEKNVKETLKLTKRIETQAAITTNQETPKAIMQKAYSALEPLQDAKKYQNLISALELAVTKCHYLRLVQYISDWKCDRQYFSTKMFLSEDCLTFGNTASSGYPGLIGNIPFDTGMYAFEVTPSHLECNGKEGFGIIEREKYISVFNADKATPTIHEHMIGFMYKNVAKNMVADKICDMKMDTKYYVKVNMIELSMIILGPGVSLRAELKSGMVYAPCFSCGCSSNRIKIRPLDSFDEDISIT